MIKLSRASIKKNEGLTIRTNQLNKRYKVNSGDRFVAIFDDIAILFKASRNGTTLYANKKSANVLSKLPKVGQPIELLLTKLIRL